MASQLTAIIVTLAGRFGRPLDDRAASLVEYTLLVAFLALACLSALTFFGSSTGGSLDDSGSSITTAN